MSPVIDEVELASMLGISVRTLRTRLAKGEVPRPLSSSPKTRRWGRAVIEKWLAGESVEMGAKKTASD